MWRGPSLEGPWWWSAVPGLGSTGGSRALAETTWWRGLKVEKPFDVPLGEDAVVEVMPFRGRNIFHRMHFEDCGAFQFWGVALDNIVCE
eukprot:1414491-Rhodomonas_salina.2